MWYIKLAVKFYDRKTKKFYIRIPKLVHIGSVKKNKNNKKILLTDEDKINISEFVNKVEFFGTELGAKTIISTSDHDIFKIRDEVNKNKDLINKININKMQSKRKSNNIDKIIKQLGLQNEIV